MVLVLCISNRCDELHRSTTSEPFLCTYVTISMTAEKPGTNRGWGDLSKLKYVKMEVRKVHV